MLHRLFAVFLLAAPLVGCPTDEPPPPKTWECVLTAGQDADFAQQIGCEADFNFLASLPLDASIPGARSVKTVLDRTEDNAQYFQNSNTYLIHWEFATAHLSAPDHAPVPQLAQFNTSEYFSPSRRFLLGAVTYYQGPDVFVWEIAPYDTADVDMITTAFRSIVENSYFGERLFFHPTSEAVSTTAEGLPDDIPIMTTDELFAGIDYQPLNLALSMGRLAFVDLEHVETVEFRDIVVLEQVPNDISAVQGLITQAFQTPLSHVNVLSQNRGTPNMGLRGAWTNETLRALEGSWIELTVGAFDWSVREVTREEADTWWEENRPDPIDVGPMDTTIQTITDVGDVLDLENLSLGDAITAAVPAFGGKASHFAGLNAVPEIPNPPGFVIPVYFFDQYMIQNGFWDRVEAMLVDEEFLSNTEVRLATLAQLRDDMEVGTVDSAFEAALLEKMQADFPDTRMRFRSSTNAEDIGGFNGAGLYTSRSGEIADPESPVLDAVRKVWASVYTDRAYGERTYYGIDHRNIGMALLCHRSFPDEDSNGVAITANIFDPAGLQPGFYVNVQDKGESVVLPAPGVTTDQFIYYYTQSGQPIVYLFHSNQIPDGETVLTTAEAFELGQALEAIHNYFLPVYGGTAAFYGMDVEFKFDSSAGNGSELYVKQARPYPGWGAVE